MDGERWRMGRWVTTMGEVGATATNETRERMRGERATVGSARERDGVSDTDDVIRENAHRWRPTSATTIDDVAGDDGETEVFGDERATLRRGVHGEKRKEAPDASERETFGGFGNASDGNFGASALEFK
jgi:hypothetical protein